MTTTAPTPGADLPATCDVTGWVIFWPGWHKGELYGVERCRRIPANFARLTARTPRAKLGPESPGAAPVGKLGHDPQQLLAERLKRSVGFISVGDVTRCAEVPGYPGHVEIDVRNVPTRLVGGEIAAGRYNSGSVELKPGVRDPDDPAKAIDGPILTAVAFLGEEPPALNECHPDLQARTRPRATFADGTPVPANPEPPPELVAAMSDVAADIARRFGGEYDPARRAARIGGREFSAAAVCFSDFTPPRPTHMTPEQKAQLEAAGFTPEQIAQMEAALTAAPPAVPPTNPTMSDGAKPAGTPADGGDAPAWFKAYADEQKQCFADLTKRVGAVEMSAESQQKKDADAQTAAFSAEVDDRLAKLARKKPPVYLEALKKRWHRDFAPAAKTFSSEGDRVKAFAAEFAEYAALPDDPRLAQPAGKPAEVTPVTLAQANPVLAAMTARGTVLDRVSPALAKQYRA